MQQDEDSANIVRQTVEGVDTHEDQELASDDDFNPALLCPDVIMEVNEVPMSSNEINGISNHIHNIVNGRPIQFSEIHCTACNCHLGSALACSPNMFVHPLLNVLVCKNCYEYYTSGDFEKDEDGTEMYCRWCGQGGNVMCCAACPMVFCQTCIQINFDDDKLQEIKNNDDWKCFGCDPEQIKHLKIQYCELAEYFQREMSHLSDAKKNNRLMRRDYSKCCGEKYHDKSKREKGSDDTLIEARAEQLTKNINCLLKIPPPTNQSQPVNVVPSLQPVNCTGTPLTVLSFKRPFHNVNSATGFIRQGNQMTPVRLLPQQQLVPRYVAQAPYPQHATMQPLLAPKTFVCKSTQVDYSTYDSLKNVLDKAVCSTALANSTVASSLLELSALTDKCVTINDCIAMYNTLQGALTTYIKSLVEIKDQAVRGTSSFVAGTIINDQTQVKNITPGTLGPLKLVSFVRQK
ncbi:unnamed protein product [Acanthoscelides obtectus]|uniref:PHD-type domain-containing protein n=1 Tax=Acanthoscelides obtectus TaxID=200917 RepID=A0A9P0PYV0_ACAOB